MQYPRPLSPHLQVYRLAFSTVLSGLHRVTGLVLSAGSLLLVAWLYAAARGAGPYAAAGGFFASLPVRVVLVGTMASFWYHLFAGIRHLCWDAGLGFEQRAIRTSGAIAVTLAALASLLTLAAAWRLLAGAS